MNADDQYRVAAVHPDNHDTPVPMPRTHADHAFVPALCQITRDTYGDRCVACDAPATAHVPTPKRPELFRIVCRDCDDSDTAIVTDAHGDALWCAHCDALERI